MISKRMDVVGRFNEAMEVIEMRHRTLFTKYSENEAQTIDDMVDECRYWLEEYDGRKFFTKRQKEVLKNFIEDYDPRRYNDTYVKPY